MRLKLTVSMEGIKASLERLSTKMQRSVMGKALRAGARLVRNDARSLAPVKTGALGKSIRVGTARAKKKGQLVIFMGTGSRLFKGKQFYGGFQEFGWKSGKRNRSTASAAKRFARELEAQAREARKLGEGRGLASRGSPFRQRQMEFFRQQGWRMAEKLGLNQRRQNPGEHYIRYAFEARGADATRVVQETLRAELAAAIAAERGRGR